MLEDTVDPSPKIFFPIASAQGNMQEQRQNKSRILKANWTLTFDCRSFVIGCMR